VYLERAFSEPQDYQFPKQPLSMEQRREALKYTVINPSRIPDSLFLEISGIDKFDWVALSSTEQMEKKRAYIPLLKELFFESFPLMTRHQGSTGRVVRLPFHKQLPNVAGSYLIFQELSYLDAERISRREPRNNVVSTKIIPDIWSLARSQEHAIQSLDEKIAMIQTCQLELVGLRVDYPDLTEAERRTQVLSFLSKFDRKQGFAFKKILNVRKPKLKYSNAGIDESIFHGMYNDLEKYMLELVSKRSQFHRQVTLLRNMAYAHKTQFLSFFETFRGALQPFDTTSLEEKILHISLVKPEISFSQIEANAIGRIWHTIRSYGNVLSEPSMIGAPFFEVESRVVESLKIVKKSTPKTNIRELYQLVLHAKLTLGNMLLYDLQDQLSTGEYESQKDTYSKEFEKMITACESLSFLNRIKSEKLDQKFQQKLSQLKGLLPLMKSGEIETLTSAVKRALEK